MPHPPGNRFTVSTPFLGVGLAVAGALALASMGHPAPTPRLDAPLASRDLRFADLPDGGVGVTDGRSGAPVAVLAPGHDGFIRATLRGLARERRRDELGPETPFRLSRWPNGGVTLEDPATGRSVDLRAFGSTNLEAFGRLLGPEGPGGITR